MDLFDFWPPKCVLLFQRGAKVMCGGQYGNGDFVSWPKAKSQQQIVYKICSPKSNI